MYEDKSVKALCKEKSKCFSFEAEIVKYCVQFIKSAQSAHIPLYFTPIALSLIVPTFLCLNKFKYACNMSRVRKNITLKENRFTTNSVNNTNYGYEQALK